MTKPARTGWTKADAPNDLGYSVPVTYDHDRAAQDLPAWASEDTGFYMDSEVDETP